MRLAGIRGQVQGLALSKTTSAILDANAEFRCSQTLSLKLAWNSTTGPTNNSVLFQKAYVRVSIRLRQAKDRLFPLLIQKQPLKDIPKGL